MGDFVVALSRRGLLPDRIRERLPPAWQIYKDWGGTLLATRLDLTTQAKLIQLGDVAYGQVSIATYRSSPSVTDLWTDLEAAGLSDADELNDRLLRPCLELNGHFSLFRIEDGCFAAISDTAGTIPVYYADDGDIFCAGTNPNIVALMGGRDRPDPVSINDFLVYGYVCHPYSWFADVRVVNPASVLVCGRHRSGLRTAYYWWPGKECPAKDLSAAARMLRERLQRNVEAAVAGCSRAALLYSAGKDSRVIASLIPRTSPRQGYIFLQEKNREYMLAAASAKLLGMPLTALFRGPDHYVVDLEGKQNLVGFGHDLFHAHGFGLEDQIAEPIVLGGAGADSFLKGLYAAGPRRALRVPRDDLLGPYRDEVAARRARMSGEIAKLSPTAPQEWRAIWPMCGLRVSSHFALNRRRLPACEPFLYANIIALAAQIGVEDKRSGELYRLAFRDALGPSALIPTSSREIMALSRRQNQLLSPLVGLAFRLQGLLTLNPKGQDAWAGRKNFRASQQYQAMLKKYASVLSEFDGGVFQRWQHELAASKTHSQATMSFRLLQTAAAVAKSSTW